MCSRRLANRADPARHFSSHCGLKIVARIFAPLIYISQVLSSVHGTGSANSGWKLFLTVLNPSAQIAQYSVTGDDKCLHIHSFQLIIF